MTRFSDLTLSKELEAEFQYMLYNYPDIETVMSELISYMSYEATTISFKYVKDKYQKKYLCICGDDGGLNDGNIEALTSQELGKSSKNNISKFGAGARTACKDYTERNNETLQRIRWR